VRPSASIIVPFLGDDAELAVLLTRLERLRRDKRDELVVVDNRPLQLGPPRSHGSRVIAARELQTPAFARNAGARQASGTWLVFLDADVVPRPDLLDRYLDPPPAADVGVLAGGVRDVAASDTLCSRYVVARAKMDERIALGSARGPYAQAANCAVRASAFAEIGGFEPLARAGEDADLCWRLSAGGWRIEHRPRASVEHLARASLRELLTQLAGHGSGMAWLQGRYPGAFPAPGARELLGRVPRHLLEAVRGRGDQSRFALIDLLALCARDLGRLRSNTPRGASAAARAALAAAATGQPR
jgi:cellulose synthase/poly-beta-1,6-N-acetylglucosamine synthase-like glycosyltransferase